MKRRIPRPKLRLRRKEEGGGMKFYARKYWYVFFLIAIFLSSWYFRSIPGRWNELIGLDEFLFYRIARDTLNNNLVLPALDTMRYYPLGVSTWEVDYTMPIYLPVIAYLFASAIGISMPFLQFAIFFPAFIGAVGAIIGFFIAKELFKSNTSGLFAAFFVSMTPALFTRTSAASFEKEATAVIFMMAAIWLFLKSYNSGSSRSSWFYGILSGLSLALMSLSWGGVQYIYLVFAAFFGIIFIVNVALVVLNYLFSGIEGSLNNLEKFMGPSMMMAYIPMIILGTVIQSMTPHNIGSTHFSVLAAYGVGAVLLLRYGLIRFKLVKKEKAAYIIPAMMLVGVVVFFAASIMTDFFDSLIGSFMSLLTLSRSVIGSTVAENAPGDWNTIFSTLGTGFSSGTLPYLGSLAPFFALWIFMFLGAFLIVYEIYKTQNWLLIFPLVWLGSTMFSIFWMVRLLFILGPAAGIVAGFFFGWMAQKIAKTKYLTGKTMRSRINFVTVPIIALVVLLVAVNMASTYTYAMSMNTAICFPRTDDKGNAIPCITVDNDGKEVMNLDGQPWYQAMDFLANKTPKESVILSWWDFGYWFQTRGERPSVADGGNLGGKYLRNYELAEWYMDKPSNWSMWEKWMGGYSVDYIFMDYTLPGKYGAISKIGSRGENVYGFLEFGLNRMIPDSANGNKTTIEYTAGQYSIWLPFDNNGALSGTPTFLVSQNGKYYQKNYVNEMCTVGGIIQVGNQSNAVPGCIASVSFGGFSNVGSFSVPNMLFYIPPETKDTIFTSLMFMQGYGLPVEKVFDNGAVQIYKVNYGAGTSSA